MVLPVSRHKAAVCAEGLLTLSPSCSVFGGGGSAIPSTPHFWERTVAIRLGTELGTASWGWGQEGRQAGRQNGWMDGWMDGQTDGLFPPVGQAGVPSDSLNQYDWSQ